MSEILANKITPVTGTTVTLGDSGDTFTIPSGVNITNSGTATGFGGGKVVQVVNVTTSTYASGTTLIPNDATTPLITEGDEYMTLAITPTHASNILRVEWHIGIHSGNGVAVQYSALFNTDLHASIARASVASEPNAANVQGSMVGSFWVAAGTTSATTFRVRAGTSIAGTFSFNGSAGGDRHSTSGNSSITIWEIGA